MVAQVLQQAAGVSVAPDVSFDMLDYILSLREGIMDAWGGILLAFKESPKGLSKLPLRDIERANFKQQTYFKAMSNLFSCFCK